jgi:hypothetical protein
MRGLVGAIALMSAVLVPLAAIGLLVVSRGCRRGLHETA